MLFRSAGAAATNAPLTEEEEILAERSRYWLPSGVTEDYLTELVEGGFLPTKADCSWRAPGDEGFIRLHTAFLRIFAI